MRIMRRGDRERSHRTAKGCTHVWRIRNLTCVLSGTRCEVCERCGVLQVVETDEPAAPVALRGGASEVRQHEDTALEAIA